MWSGRKCRAASAVTAGAGSPHLVAERSRWQLRELRAALRGGNRVSPYVLGGFGAGVSRPNVNDTFPDPVTNNVRAFFFGGGISVPLRQRIHVFADARMIVGAEAGELLAIAPARAGIAWRF